MPEITLVPGVSSLPPRSDQLAGHFRRHMGDRGRDAPRTCEASRDAERWDAPADVEVVAEREFVPAKRDVAQLSTLAGLEKLSVVSYNVLSQLGARRLLRPDMRYVDPGLLNIVTRRQRLLRCVRDWMVAVSFASEADTWSDRCG